MIVPDLCLQPTTFEVVDQGAKLVCSTASFCSTA